MPEMLIKTPAPLTRPHTKPYVPHPEAEWLVLAYLAADNDLEGELLSDLAEMERVASTPGVVEILAQVGRSPRLGSRPNRGPPSAGASAIRQWKRQDAQTKRASEWPRADGIASALRFVISTADGRA